MLHASSPKTYFYIGFFLAIILLFHWLGLTRPLEVLLRSSTSSILAQLNSAITGLKKQSIIFNRSKLVKNFADCQNASQDQQVLSVQLQLLSRENDELRKQLAFKIKTTIPSIGATVVSKDITHSQQTIVIDRGTNAGVAVGQPVIAGNGVLVGVIKSVTPDSSIVLLINDNQSKIAATIINHDHSLGIVGGGYGISLRMYFIPRNETIAVGDHVVTSGLEGRVPGGLLIGSVTVVENEAYQPFQQAAITPSADIAKLTAVSILLTQ